MDLKDWYTDRIHRNVEGGEIPPQTLAPQSIMHGRANAAMVTQAPPTRKLARNEFLSLIDANAMADAW